MFTFEYSVQLNNRINCIEIKELKKSVYLKINPNIDKIHSAKNVIQKVIYVRN